MVETSISWLLKQDASINESLQDRVSPFLREDNDTYPAVTYQKTGFDQDTTMDGSLSNLAKHYIDIDIWDMSYQGVKTLADKIKKHLTSFSGDANGNQIDLIKFNDYGEDIEPEPERYLVTLKLTFYTDEA